MRELWRTGYMHNRVRMVVASFLIKNLLIDWRLGEQWFWDTLVDADEANNAGNWQWVAGSGADAAPYFRVFNPELQASKFDPQGEYVRRWVPELGTDAYPAPIVDLAASRREALARYDRMRRLGPAADGRDRPCSHLYRCCRSRIRVPVIGGEEPGRERVARAGRIDDLRLRPAGICRGAYAPSRPALMHDDRERKARR